MVVKNVFWSGVDSEDVDHLACEFFGYTDSDFVVLGGKGCFYIAAGLHRRDVSGTVINPLAPDFFF
jgi:hypothetical protein